MKKKNLLYGIGNPAREDDGLGHEFIHSLPDHSDWDIEFNYQLNIEDADLFSQYERIVVVDAAMDQESNVLFQEIDPSFSPEFSGHALGLESVLSLCREIYKKSPKLRLLSLKGKSFNLKMGMTPEAQLSLTEGLAWFKKEVYVSSKSF